MPVTPALLRWRVWRAGKVIRRWHSPVEFRRSLLPRDLFPTIYARGTRQNRPNQPGRYRFYLCHGWRTKQLTNGAYRIEVEAADISGNHARASLPLVIAN